MRQMLVEASLLPLFWFYFYIFVSFFFFLKLEMFFKVWVSSWFVNLITKSLNDFLKLIIMQSSNFNIFNTHNKVEICWQYSISLLCVHWIHSNMISIHWYRSDDQLLQIKSKWFFVLFFRLVYRIKKNTCNWFSISQIHWNDKTYLHHNKIDLALFSDTLNLVYCDTNS